MSWRNHTGVPRVPKRTEVLQTHITLFLAKSLVLPCGFPSDITVWWVSVLACSVSQAKTRTERCCAGAVSAGPRDARHSAGARRCLSVPTRPLAPTPAPESILHPDSRGPGWGSAGGGGAPEQRCARAHASAPTPIALWLLETGTRSQIKLELKEDFSSLSPQ